MPRTVLVADDEPLTAEMLALMLAFRGYEVVCAFDGDTALLGWAHWAQRILA